MQTFKLNGWGPPPYPWINYEIPLIDLKPKQSTQQLKVIKSEPNWAYSSSEIYQINQEEPSTVAVWGHLSDNCWCGYGHLDTTPQPQQLDWAHLTDEFIISQTPIKLTIEVWHQCPTCKRDFNTTFKNPTPKDFDNIAEHLNKDIPLCQECGCYYE